MDKRRFLSMLYFVLLTCLLILPCSKDVNGADWYFYGKATSGILASYDANSIIVQSNNIIRVWTNMIPASEEDRVRYTQNTKKIGPTLPDNWGHSKCLYEIDCKNKKYMVLQLVDFSTEDKLIKSETIANPSYTYVVPETMAENLYKIVCAKKDTKKKGR